MLYLAMGIPASGKTTFCQRVLADPALDIVSQDVSGTRAREWVAFEAALAKRRSVAVDDTNVEKERRGRFLAAAKAAGYRTVGLFFQSVLRHAFRIDDEIPVFANAPEWLEERLVAFPARPSSDGLCRR